MKPRRIKTSEPSTGSNRSLALWFSPRAGIAECGAQAHFNYWRIAGDEGFRGRDSVEAADVLEIGVMLEEPAAIADVWIYIPSAVASSAVSDCSEYFADPAIAQGIFNEILTSGAGGRPGPRGVELRQGPDVFCRVHQFMINPQGIDPSELSIAEFAEGTLLHIHESAIDEARRAGPGRVYFRLRVTIDRASSAAFVRTIAAPDKLLQSGFEEIEYIDFRLNEARTLPAQVESLMRPHRAAGVVKLRLVAFLTAVPVRSALTASNTQFHKLRLLEHQLWSEYIPSGIPEGMTVYHWKREAADGLSEFAAFVKLQTRRSGTRILMKYLGVAFVFGMLGNLAASGVEPALIKGWDAVVGIWASPADELESSAGGEP